MGRGNIKRSDTGADIHGNDNDSDIDGNARKVIDGLVAILSEVAKIESIKIKNRSGKLVQIDMQSVDKVYFIRPGDEIDLPEKEYNDPAVRARIAERSIKRLK